MGKIDWDVVTNYTDVITTTLKTVTFPKVQEQVYLRNQGNANFTYTIGSQSGTLTPGQSVTVIQDVSSFTLQAVSGTHTFELRAKEKGTEINETDYTAGTVKKVNGTSPDATGNVTIAVSQVDTSTLATKTDVQNISKGSPSGVYATLTALQTAFPTGNSNIYVVTADGKWYYWSGTAWTAGGTYQATGIPSKSITQDMMAAPYVPGVKSSNLFDSSIVTSGKYVNMSTGTLSTNASFSASDYIAVDPNTQYIFANYAGGDQGAFYDSSKVYISGFGAKIITTPVNAAYVRFGCLTTELPTQKFEKGNISTPYEAYGSTFIGYESLTNDAKGKLLKKASNVIWVSQDGKTDYTKINDAVTNTGDGNTILVTAGTYDEMVEAFGKDLSIIGLDKKRCILKNTNGDYNTPPLEMSAGYLANMTIYSQKLAGAVSPATLGYGVHIDNSSSQNKTMLVENCDIISDWNSAVGIGMWNGFTLTFRNCNFYCHNVTQTNGAVFFHNAQTDGSLNQNIVFDNCRIISDSDIGLYAGDALTTGSSPLNTTFYNTMIYSKTTGKSCLKKTIGSKWSGNNISLSPDSYGNNITELNL
jgi:hypothetical protein